MPAGKVKSEFVVLAVDGEALSLRKVGLASSAEANRWIKREGDDGTVYQVAILRGDPVRVSVETVTKRKLVPVED